MRLTLSLTALLLFPLATLPAEAWQAFGEQVTVYAAPSREAEILGILVEGDERSGEIWEDPDTREEWLTFSVGEQTGHVSLTQMNRIHPANLREGDLPIGEEVVNRWWGLPHTYEPSDLVTVPPEFTVNAERTYQLRAEAQAALVEMLTAARADGVDIRVTSAYRSGMRQRNIYRRSCERNGPGQRRSARPGHSEHQLGTTVDLSDPASEWAFTEEFNNIPQGRWLAEHGGKYGFVRTYFPHNVEETGYVSEPWHWRYFGR
jgi:LAS superfamily LD-carboxypeptidase LdcB